MREAAMTNILVIVESPLKCWGERGVHVIEPTDLKWDIVLPGPKKSVVQLRE